MGPTLYFRGPHVYSKVPPNYSLEEFEVVSITLVTLTITHKLIGEVLSAPT